jgi:hypothetical protein
VIALVEENGSLTVCTFTEIARTSGRLVSALLAAVVAKSAHGMQAAATGSRMTPWATYPGNPDGTSRGPSDHVKQATGERLPLCGPTVADSFS